MSLAVVVVAAGSGTRLGADRPKALVEVDGRSLLAHCLDRVLELAPAELVVVHPAGHHAAVLAACVRAPEAVLVAGGATRSESVRNGLAALRLTHEAVAVHDAARPFQSARVMRAAVAAVRDGADVLAAAPALAVADTLKQLDAAGDVAGTVPRATVRAVQTPQVLGPAAVGLLQAGGEGTDDLSVVEAAVTEGRLVGRVVLTPGDVAGTKVTWPEDLAALAGAAPPPAPTAPAGPASLRIGQGVDVHPFADEERPLVLGGHTVARHGGLAGHSDADVVCHAVIDALLGATARGDIGERFGVDEPATEGASSARMLAQVAREVTADGWSIANVDCTVLAQHPRLSPHRAAIRAGLSDALGVDEGVVGVKFSTTDHLGAVGRGEGIACQAVVLLST